MGYFNSSNSDQKAFYIKPLKYFDNKRDKLNKQMHFVKLNSIRKYTLKLKF